MHAVSNDRERGFLMNTRFKLSVLSSLPKEPPLVGTVVFALGIDLFSSLGQQLPPPLTQGRWPISMKQHGRFVGRPTRAALAHGVIVSGTSL
jgi:hypothetical protein